MPNLAAPPPSWAASNSALVSLFAAPLVLGCAPPPSSTTSSAGEATETEDFGTASLHGHLVDLEGEPVVDVLVTASDEFCIPGRTTADGAFSVERIRDGTLRLVTYGETGPETPYASIVLPVEVQGRTHLSQPVRVPALIDKHPIDPAAAMSQIITAADGLELTILPNSLTFAPFFEHDVFVAQVPTDVAPSMIPASIELVDLHVLHPIGSKLDPPAPIRIPTDLDLPVGTPLIFHSLNYQTGLLAPTAKGSVGPSGTLDTHPDEGVPELTWIGVSIDEP